MKTLSINPIRFNFLFAATVLLLTACGSDANQESDASEMLIEQDSIAEVLEEVEIQRDTLTGNWINLSFRDAVLNNKSVYFSQNKLLPIAEIVIDESTNQMQLVFGYNEGCTASFTREADKLSTSACDSNADLKFVFDYDPFKKEMLLTTEDITYRFVRTSNKTEPSGAAVQRMLATEVLNGNWQSAKSSKPFGGKISFDSKGFIRGLSSYNKYSFVLAYDSYPAFMDVIHLYKGALTYDAWYWQLDGDSLRFFSYNEAAPDLFETKAVYYRAP